LLDGLVVDDSVGLVDGFFFVLVGLDDNEGVLLGEIEGNSDSKIDGELLWELGLVDGKFDWLGVADNEGAALLDGDDEVVGPVDVDQLGLWVGFLEFDAIGDWLGGVEVGLDDGSILKVGSDDVVG
jgi:hypothetical protein